MIKRLAVSCAGLLAMVLIGSSAIEGQRRPRPPEQASRSESAGPETRITTILENGGRLDWSAANNLIAFDRRIDDGYFDIYTMTPTGGDQTCVTCDKKALPPRSKGNPAWHPSGDYIVFQAQTDYAGLGKISKGLGKITDYAANPGAGVNNNVWVMDRRGERFWQLTDLKPRVTGVLHPQFSRNGDRLLWAERISAEGSWGKWALQVADFYSSGGNVRISNERMFRPGAQQRMYESHGFSPDGQQVLFSGNLESGQDEVHGDIYLFDLRTEQLRNLTNSMDEWDEHAHFSPDGRTIVWMTSKGLPETKKASAGAIRTDYWMMDADGGNKRRLTYFNTPGHPESVEPGAVAADFAWSPDGTRLAAYIITDVRKGGKIVMIELR